ncbi:hypothetical protein J7L27_03515 [Candidatus Bathyarchaeota archaeon]|nr:hypothetical protein [Candidatus Bathyarchaeota archaeon]
MWKLARFLGTIGMFLSLIFIANCSWRIADLTVASTKNVEMGAEYVRVATGVRGSDIKSIIIFIPTGHPNLEEAVDRALEKADGELMTNVVLYQKWWWIPYIYGQIKYEVKGDIWKRKEKSVGFIDKDLLSKAQKIYKAVEKDGKIQLVEIDKTEIR